MSENYLAAGAFAGIATDKLSAIKRIVAVEPNGDIELVLRSGDERAVSLGAKRRVAGSAGSSLQGLPAAFRIYQEDHGAHHGLMEPRIGDAAGQQVAVHRGTLRNTGFGRGEEPEHNDEPRHMCARPGLGRPCDHPSHLAHFAFTSMIHGRSDARGVNVRCRGWPRLSPPDGR